MLNFLKKLFRDSSEYAIVSWAIDTDEGCDPSLQFVEGGRLGIMIVDKVSKIRIVIAHLSKKNIFGERIFENRDKFDYDAINYDQFMKYSKLHGIATGAEKLKRRLKKELRKLEVNTQILIFDFSTGESKVIYI